MSQARNPALRVLAELLAAAKGNYWKNGWDFYISRDDVEACALAAVDPTEAATYRKLRDEALNAR